MPKLIIYEVHEQCLEIVPGRSKREWMEATRDRYAYRCLPMTVANSSGWEVLSPCHFEATWTGTDDEGAISLKSLDGFAGLNRFASSHFGHGILTIHPGYVFVTDPGWGVIVRGAPNFLKDGIQPLDGLIETDWLPFTFTMNWSFTRPTSVTFQKGDPLAFFTLTQHLLLDDIQPEIHDIRNNRTLYARFSEWKEKREIFIRSLSERDPATMRQRWQRNYFLGVHHDGSPAPETHIVKRNLKTPIRSG